MKLKEEQFKALIQTWDRRLHNICNYYCADKDERDDLLQEILINLWKGLESFRGEASAGTWLYRVAVNTALSFKGRELKRKENHCKLESIPPILSEDDENRQLQVEQTRNLERLNMSINQLSIIDKAIISLYLEEVPLKEVAEIIGINEPNVRVKIHRIKETLKQQMKGGANE
jgi:RNA polymerase sigma-70 factor (ECF subfamily)